MEKSDDKKNVLPLRKSDPFCHNKGGTITNALFLIQMAVNTEELEQDVVTHLLEMLSDLFEQYQENDFHAEIIYKDITRLQSMVDSFYSEATMCPGCKSFNIQVEETDEETHNTCLDCQKTFITE